MSPAELMSRVSRTALGAVTAPLLTIYALLQRILRQLAELQVPGGTSGLPGRSPSSLVLLQHPSTCLCANLRLLRASLLTAGLSRAGPEHQAKPEELGAVTAPSN